jgi:hypothetical protein
LACGVKRRFVGLPALRKERTSQMRSKAVLPPATAGSAPQSKTLARESFLP